MMTNKKLSDIKAEVAALLGDLPAKSPKAWLTKQIEAAKADPGRDVQTLEMLCAALDEAARKSRKPKKRLPAKR
jgi:hypothetical protein